MEQRRDLVSTLPAELRVMITNYVIDDAPNFIAERPKLFAELNQEVEADSVS